jgi:uncharacterized protein (DUF58 family)
MKKRFIILGLFALAVILYSYFPMNGFGIIFYVSIVGLILFSWVKKD